MSSAISQAKGLSYPRAIHAVETATLLKFSPFVRRYQLLQRVLCLVVDVIRTVGPVDCDVYKITSSQMRHSQLCVSLKCSYFRSVFSLCIINHADDCFPPPPFHVCRGCDS